MWDYESLRCQRESLVASSPYDAPNILLRASVLLKHLQCPVERTLRVCAPSEIADSSTSSAIRAPPRSSSPFMNGDDLCASLWPQSRPRAWGGRRLIPAYPMGRCETQFPSVGISHETTLGQSLDANDTQSPDLPGFSTAGRDPCLIPIENGSGHVAAANQRPRTMLARCDISADT